MGIRMDQLINKKTHSNTKDTEISEYVVLIDIDNKEDTEKVLNGTTK